MKKASIWISAVLYIALGVLIITLVLAAGMPLIEKMKDQNVFVQSKKMMYVLDQNIRDVANEGPGSRRYLSPFEINKGSVEVDLEPNNITWTMLTTNKLMEYNSLDNLGDLQFKEGNLIIWLDETKNEDEYLLTLKLPYEDFAEINLGKGGNPLSGKYALSIYHTGEFENDAPIISLEFT